MCYNDSLDFGLYSSSKLFYSFDLKNEENNNGENSNINIIDNSQVQTEESPIIKELSPLLRNKRENKSSDDCNSKGSIRNLNQMNGIKRYLIQICILNWLNFSILNRNEKLKKIEPEILKKKYKKINNMLDLPLKDIYWNNICKKEIKGNITLEHNKIIIQNVEKNSDLDIKMNLKFRDVLRMFFNVDFSLENELNVNNNIREGLEDYIQYFRDLVDAHKKYLSIAFKTKFIKNLNSLFLMVKNDTKPSERSTNQTDRDNYDEETKRIFFINQK